MSPQNSIVVKYENILTTKFIANVFIRGDYYPDEGAKDGIRLLVAAIWKGRHEDYADETTTTYYEACLMDGSHSLFRARVSPEMNSYIAKNRDIIGAGSVLRIHYYSLLWLVPTAKGEHRMVMLIDAFSVVSPPARMICGVLPPTVNRRAISKRAVKEVLQLSNIVFLGERELGGSSQWTAIPLHLVKQGYFLPDVDDKTRWLGNTLGPTRQSTPACDCQNQLQFASCILETRPMAELDEEWMLKTIGYNADRSVGFESLSPLQKRECVTKHYKLFYFSVHHGEYSLPSCFRQHLRAKYPHPDNKSACVSPYSAQEN